MPQEDRMSAYPTKSAASAGSVTARRVTTEVIDVTVTPVEVDGDDAEVVIRVNGRPLARMNQLRAARMGLIEGVRY